jgi:hypothetical protein
MAISSSQAHWHHSIKSTIGCPFLVGNSARFRSLASPCLLIVWWLFLTVVVPFEGLPFFKDCFIALIRPSGVRSPLWKWKQLFRQANQTITLIEIRFISCGEYKTRINFLLSFSVISPLSAMLSIVLIGAALLTQLLWSPVVGENLPGRPEWMAAFGPPSGHPTAPSKRRPNFVQPLGSTHIVMRRWAKKMRKPECAECEQLFKEYSAAVFAHVKIDSRMKMADLRDDVTDDLHRDHKAATEGRKGAQRRLNEHEATHSDAGAASGMA